MTAVGRKTQRLVEVLEEMATLLESDGDTQWRSWAIGAKDALMRGDDSGIRYVLGVYGGMGSLNDLVLGQTSENGVFAWKPGAQKLNNRFDVLRSRAWELAREISIRGTLI